MMLSRIRCTKVIKFCNRDLESTPEFTQYSVRVGKSVDGSDNSIDAAGWVDFQPTRQISSMAFSIILPTVAIADLT
ncbi:hypothetical protein [uncultured Nostoc sp.]|uniref:hypothetical protein n=1 Tax=uncultured Nostoc sp. TaxID=340711 RepID=UPI0035C987E4